MDSWVEKLGIKETNPGVFAGDWGGQGETVEQISPVNGKVIARVRLAAPADYEKAVGRAEAAFLKWRTVPAPVRGETVRQLGNALRSAKKDLGKLVTIETGKILPEGEGEVQEMIDICDFAVGLSRQLYGLTIQSERPRHRLMEQWHPLGVIGVITAFNFPVAVWSWNSALAAVCGDATIWKPSNKVLLSAIAVTHLAHGVCHETGVDPAIFTLLSGGPVEVGERMSDDKRLPLISATGSSAMGVQVGARVARRLGRTLLELGGNNAIVVTPSADLELAVRAILFGAVGTAGQRCTTTRRLIVHESIEPKIRDRLTQAYRSVRVGNPLEPSTLMGPLIDLKAVETMMAALEQLKRQGGRVLYGGERLSGTAYPGDCYVSPCLATAQPEFGIVKEETFAPILYLMTYREFGEAIRIHNEVPQGLSSAIFTNDVREAEGFLSACGSDCGIANERGNLRRGNWGRVRRRK